jgi:hypothetical protein
MNHSKKSNKMKNLKIVLMAAIMMAPVFTFAQHQHPSANEMMKDKSMQDSVMTMICSNPKMMDKMTTHIMKNKEAMHTMMQHKGMMKEMMDMAGKDSTMCHNMMNMMMENKDMDKMMMNKMNKTDKPQQDSLMNRNQ